jgi:hypothetical protein
LGLSIFMNSGFKPACGPSIHLDRYLVDPAREARLAFGADGLHSRYGEVDADVSGLVRGEYRKKGR